MKIVSTDVAPKPVAAYSQGVEAGGFVFAAGQIGIDPATGELASGVAAQAQRAFQNVRAILAAAEVGAENIVKITIYLIDLKEFAGVNKIYEDFVGISRPARTTVGVAALPMGALIEIDAIAAV